MNEVDSTRNRLDLAGKTEPNQRVLSFGRIWQVLLALMCCALFSNNSNAGENNHAAALVREYRSALVFFEGKAGMGSGFITTIGGHKFLITNAHVLAAIKAAHFKLLDRTEVKVGAASVAVGHDLIALMVTEGGTIIPPATSVDKETEIGDAVVVLGNAEGAGVVNLIEGKLKGLGPNLVEVDAPFVPGNSGSPIIHVASGKVIGVATYAIVKKTRPREQTIRRFGFRLDSIQQWQTIDWKRFYAESDAIERIKKTTEEFVELLNDLGRRGRPAHNYETPGIRSALESLYATRGQRAGPRPAGAGQAFLSTLHAASRSDIAEGKTKCSYDFFRRQLEEEERRREEILGIFDKMVKSR